MADTTPTAFDNRSAARIASVVRSVERAPAGTLGGPSPTPGAAGEFYGRLTGESASKPGHYAWSVVDRVDGVWSDRSPRVFSSSCSAVEANGLAGLPTGTVVRISWFGVTTLSPPADSAPTPSAAHDADTDLAVSSTPYPAYLFAYGGPGLRLVSLVKDGGSDGGGGVGATWTYTVRDYDTGVTLGTKVPVLTPRRLPVEVIPATLGLARGGSPIGSGSGSGAAGSGSASGPSGTVLLVEAYEVYEVTEACSGFDNSGSGSGSGE